jgi:rhamnulokinase
MGMWLLEQSRRTWESQGENTDYATLFQMAQVSPPFKCLVDPDDTSFLNPPDMTEAIASFCRSTDQPEPGSVGEYVRCILESLALKYRFLVDKLTQMRRQPIRRIHIVGGGSQNQLLNQFAANALGIPIVAGPVEATAIGNILIQAVAQGVLDSLASGRDLVAHSFPLIAYEPEPHTDWENQYIRACKLFN